VKNLLWRTAIAWCLDAALVLAFPAFLSYCDLSTHQEWSSLKSVLLDTQPKSRCSGQPLTQKIGNVVMSGGLGQPPLIDTRECGLTSTKLNDVTPSWRRCRGSAPRQGLRSMRSREGVLLRGPESAVNEMTFGY
jgi:hypothetical protein